MYHSSKKRALREDAFPKIVLARLMMTLKKFLIFTTICNFLREIFVAQAASN